MKHWTKLIAAAAAVVMAVALCVPALAYASTITINPGTPTGGAGVPQYDYYVMMKATVNGDKVAYYVEDETLATAIDGLKVGEDDLFTVTKASGADRWNVVINKKADNTAFTGEEVAAAFATIKDNAIAKSVDGGTSYELKDGDAGYDGYVLVESSLGTKLVIDTITSQTINEKNTYPSVTKTEDVSSAEIGGTVNYELPIVIPATVAEKPIVAVDTMTEGLTLNPAITADNGVTGLSWTLKETLGNGSNVYTVEIPAATVKSLAGKTLTLKYSATVNENAVVNDPEINTAHLEYDNFSTVETEPVEVTTFGFDIYKIGDGDADNPLANVEFTLTNAAGNYYDATADSNPRFSAGEKTAKTDAEGKIAFAGLAQGEYILTEVVTNDGYNLLAGPITVTIDEDGNATFSGAGAEDMTGNAVQINNQSGSLLPSTGGMGTTILYIVGGIMIVVAGVYLVSRRRDSKSNDSDDLM